MADSGNVNPAVSYLCPSFGCCQEVTGLVAGVAQNWKLQSFLLRSRRSQCKILIKA